MTSTTPNTDQNKAPTQAPNTENKTPEQLALDKKSQENKTGSDQKTNNDNNDKNDKNDSSVETQS